MIQQVVLAPVPWEHLASAQTMPHLAERVAFGSSSEAVKSLPIGLPVFIYGSAKGRPPSIRPGLATWHGRLGAIVRAVEGPVRSGKHPDPNERPPSAEACDGPFLWFFEVLGLQQLAAPRRLSEFTKASGRGKPFTGDVPQWPVLAYLDC